VKSIWTIHFLHCSKEPQPFYLSACLLLVCRLIACWLPKFGQPADCLMPAFLLSPAFCLWSLSAACMSMPTKQLPVFLALVCLPPCILSAVFGLPVLLLPGYLQISSAIARTVCMPPACLLPVFPPDGVSLPKALLPPALPTACLPV
jgi:hypothetical protein